MALGREEAVQRELLILYDRLSEELDAGGFDVGRGAVHDALSAIA